MPSVLRDLKIMEISSVDRGAGDGVRIVLMKRTPAETACAAMENEMGAAIKRAVENALKSPLSGGSKEVVKMNTTEIRKAGDGEFAPLLKRAIEQRTLSKAEVYAEMLARAEKLRERGESVAQSFNKCFTGGAPRVTGGAELIGLHSAYYV